MGILLGAAHQRRPGCDVRYLCKRELLAHLSTLVLVDPLLNTLWWWRIEQTLPNRGLHGPRVVHLLLHHQLLIRDFLLRLDGINQGLRRIKRDFVLVLSHTPLLL